MENKPVAGILDYETGEITNEINEGDKVKIVRDEQAEYRANHVMNFNKDEPFVKMFDKTVFILSEHLSNAAFKLAIKLASNVSYEDCILRKTSDIRSSVATLEELAEIHGYSYSNFRHLFSELKKKYVVGKHETGPKTKNPGQNNLYMYTVNPYIYFRGKNVDKAALTFYDKSGWKELINGSQDIEESPTEN